MKRFILGLTLATCFAIPALAKTPPEVLKPYKEYRAALEAGDDKTAAKHAYEAWQQAEGLLGDSKTTGDLAANFGNIKTKQYEKRIDAYERSLELTKDYGADALAVYMTRGIELANLHTTTENHSKAFKVAKSLSEYAEAQGDTSSTLYGETLTMQAQFYARKGNNKKTKEYAQKALDVFSKTNDGIISAHPILANLYAGYALEADDESIKAALSYQKVMESLDGIAHDAHPLAAQALGRWSHMRARLQQEGKLEEAEQQGLCKCWPYDKPRNESLKPIKRTPPKMPRDARVSGFTIVEFDLDDAGKVINPEIIVSWPEDVYDKSSLRVLDHWEYSPRTSKETDEDRKDLITTIRYRLADQSGDIIY